MAAKVAAIEAAPLPRIEIVGERRRAHDAEFLARVVAASICTSLIYRWRRSMLGPAPSVKLVPVRVAEARKTEPSLVVA